MSNEEANVEEGKVGSAAEGKKEEQWSCVGNMFGVVYLVVLFVCIIAIGLGVGRSDDSAASSAAIEPTAPTIEPPASKTPDEELINTTSPEELTNITSPEEGNYTRSNVTSDEETFADETLVSDNTAQSDETESPSADNTTPSESTAPANDARVGQPVDLTIFHINDHHSHLSEDTFTLDGADFQFDHVEIDVFYGGFPRLVSLIRKMELSTTNDVIKLHAGDALVGTPFFTLFDGMADAEMMQKICFDAFALGNHEFDYGDQFLADFLTTLHSGACSHLSVLSANLVPGEASPLQDLLEDGTIEQNKIVTLENGERVGIIGIDIRNKTIVSSFPDEGTTFLDERETVITQVEQLTSAGVNKIVLLTHIGYNFDLEWMVDIPGVDVIVGGDSHSLLGSEKNFGPLGGATTAGPYPTRSLAASDGRMVCVVQAWEYGRAVGQLDVSFDEEGIVLSCTGQTMIPFDPIRFEPSLSAQEATAVNSYLEGLGASFVGVSEDPETLQALTVYEGQVDMLKQEVIANVPSGICYERIPGQGRSDICTADETLNQGGGVCNLVAHAFLTQVPTADIAIQNGGGCRSDIFAGSYTINDAYTLLPFSNSLVTLTLTGETIQLVLEQAVENALSGTSTGSYPYASGLRYDVDGGAAFPNRISSLEVNRRLESDWAPIESNDLYTVVVNDYIAAGRDGYFAFADIDNDLVVELYLEYAQAFVDYASVTGELLDPPLEVYSTQSYIPPPPEATISKL